MALYHTCRWYSFSATSNKFINYDDIESIAATHSLVFLNCILVSDDDDDDWTKYLYNLIWIVALISHHSFSIEIYINTILRYESMSHIQEREREREKAL